ncbi:protein NONRESPONDING TO OXYLIPINS 2, mitochondrial-like isoform X1 [Mangifera indica]|uniref:protein NONRESPONDING TO OXYLIPINS 2, mitochondrial-like isoform X1 n=1 Tax=Mangifera indica TaxID=29780 RepID=UPI001CFB489D|nr:protein NONRESPONDING TO OXYLIPINS 2, mitochondrial-like isoform X1 [Mangifera indica]
MASLCRSAIATASKSVAARSKTTTLKTINPKSIFSAFSSSTSSLPRAARVVSILGSVESLMPLHSAIASARLKSYIAVDSTCWSWLSQGLAVTL